MTSPCAAPTPAFATAQVQAGYQPTGVISAVPPIHQTAAYEFASLAEAADLFALRRPGIIYGRNANPTQQILEERVALLEGGVSAVAVASGQAAVAVTILALVHRGGHIVAADQLYGGTIDLLQETLDDFGISVTFVDQDDIDAWREAITPRTRLLFAESVANPIAQVLDIRAVADVAHTAGVPLVIDNTVGTPHLVRPASTARTSSCIRPPSSSRDTAARWAGSWWIRAASTSERSRRDGRSSPAPTPGSATSCCGSGSGRGTRSRPS